LPEIEEFGARERMLMEKEVTGLYLSGHPMDDFRSEARRAGAVSIGTLLSSFEAGGETGEFRDGQRVTLAGLVASIKTKTTKNNSLMAYVTLEDGGGSMELLVFQRTLDELNGVLAEGLPVFAKGRISLRDEKEPQLLCDSITPIREPEDAASVRPPAEEGSSASAGRGEAAPAAENKNRAGPKTLYVRLPGMKSPEYKRLQLIKTMFIGSERIVVYFADTGKKAVSTCWIHPSLVRELTEMLGGENVVVK
jgi:DNA polymerase-3 subunit alpha